MLACCFDKREPVEHAVALHHPLLKTMVRRRFFRHEWYWLANADPRRLPKSCGDLTLRSVGERPFLRCLEVVQPSERREYMSSRRWGRISIGLGQFRFQANMGQSPKRLWIRSSWVSQSQGSADGMSVSQVDRRSNPLLSPIRERTWLEGRARRELRTPLSVERRRQEHNVKDPKYNRQCMECSHHPLCPILKYSKVHSSPLRPRGIEEL